MEGFQYDYVLELGQEIEEEKTALFNELGLNATVPLTHTNPTRKASPVKDETAEK